MLFNRFVFFVFSFILLGCQVPTVQEVKLQLIPEPAKIVFGEGYFVLDAATLVEISQNEEVNKKVNFLCSLIERSSQNE